MSGWCGNPFTDILCVNDAQVRGTTIGPTKKVRDVFSACLRIDVPQEPQVSKADGHIKLVMCFVEVRCIDGLQHPSSVILP
jgi:hypothetical protein